ncbi:MAG: hypothetical protein WC501_01585 [Candidatus Micrarchaeia archaeon]
MVDWNSAYEHGFPEAQAVQTDFPIVDAVCTAQSLNWDILVGAALFASIAILVFFYLFASFFRNDKTIAWVKIELFETISTALIIIMVFALTSGVMCNFKASWIFSDFQLQEFTSSQSSFTQSGFEFNKDSNMYAIALTYFSNIESQIIRWMSISMIGVGFSDMGTTQFKAHPMGQGFMTAPLAGFFVPLKSILNNGLIALTITFIINSASVQVLKYSLIAFPGYFLPAGIFFRAFEPTRRFGGTLIALSITFLIIYPIIIAISFYVTSIGMLGSSMGIFELFATQFSNTNPYNESTAVFSAAFMNEGIDGFFGNLVNGLSALLSAILVSVGSVFGFLYFVFGGWIIWWIMLVGFLLPAINTLIIVYSMRSLGKALGEPIDITSLTRLI